MTRFKECYLSSIALETSGNVVWLRRFSVFLFFSVVCLIFIGALVTSNDAGLSVPDWPTTYGENMFLFPPSKWVDKIFYEHTHRLVASAIGLFTMVLTVWVFLAKERRWIKWLSSLALLLVIFQGILGGITVKYYLPPLVSTLHALFAQTFLIVTLALSYALSEEWQSAKPWPVSKSTRLMGLACVAVIFLQLIVGAYMRHSGAGLAIMDFPTMGKRLIPTFDAEMLSVLNQMRHGAGLSPVSLAHVLVHFAHRMIGSLAVIFVLLYLWRSYRELRKEVTLNYWIWLGAALIIAQFLLGALVVLSVREPWITSAHVALGAVMLSYLALLTFKLYRHSYGE